MASLRSKTKNSTLIADLKVATQFWDRAKGLIGTKQLPANKGIWFPRTNWIHTMFMSMPIDVIYLDKKMNIKKLQPNLKPWRFPAPVFSANSVVEAQSGFIAQNDLEIGDTLDVGH